MAVDDFLSRDTESIVLPSKALYPVPIKIAHYQLRHFISSPEQDLIYYASGADIYCLNTATKTQAHVTKLPWEARCTASGHGYVCVGGADDGNFAAIKVEGFPPTDPSDVDASLPIDLARRSPLPRPPLLGAAHRVRLEKIGEDIVNSISIHKFAAEGDGEDEVVAVLTNNDKTVRVYSLTWGLEIAVLDLPFPMNHATISPDGQMLAAVGDQNIGFFFKRVKPKTPSSTKTPEGRPQSVPSEWNLIQEVRLHVPSGSPVEGYFTTAWSPSGRLCAVGSECGYITVFDVDLLRICEYGEDAIVQLIGSSRPDAGLGPGAVRTMMFSPAPWDLLIWSEDQARVCVADLRSNLKVRQVLSLDTNDEEVERLEIADFDFTMSPEMHSLRREADFIRRYRRALDSEGTAAAVNFATDYIEASAERRSLHRQLGVVESDDDPHGLTAQERQILEALRSTRPREEGRENGSTPRSINYSTVGSTERRYRIATVDYFPSLRSDLRNRERETRESTARSEIADLLAQLSALEELNRRQPRGLNTESAAAPVDSAAGTTAESTTRRSPNPIPTHAQRVNAQVVASTDHAWRTIEEALSRDSRATAEGRRTGVSDLGAERHSRQLAAMRERLRNAREGQPLDPYSIGGLSASYRRTRSTHDPSDGVRTAGLAMSQDGTTLYCGTEHGIFEFRINLHQRKGLPAITPR